MRRADWVESREQLAYIDLACDVGIDRGWHCEPFESLIALTPASAGAQLVDADAVGDR